MGSRERRREGREGLTRGKKRQGRARKKLWHE